MLSAKAPDSELTGVLRKVQCPMLLFLWPSTSTPVQLNDLVQLAIFKQQIPSCAPENKRVVPCVYVCECLWAVGLVKYSQ